MRQALFAILIVFVLAAVYAGLRFHAEATVGTGPVATGPAPDGPTRDIAFVANSVGGTVSLVDLGALKVIGEISIIPDGRKVGFFRDPLQSVFGQPRIERAGLNYVQDTDVSPDGRVLYVSRGNLGDVAAFDIATGALMWRRPIAGIRADHMAISPDGRQLFVSGMTADTVEVFDTATARRTGAFATGTWPHDIHVSRDGRRVYNASLGNMTLPLDRRDTPGRAGNHAYQVTVADTASLNILKRHRFAAGIRPFQITADETRLYAQLSNAHAVVEYDLTHSRLLRRTDLPVKDGVTRDDWDFESPHHGLAMSADERLLCIAGRASDYAALVAVKTLKPSAVIPVGDAPGWAATSPDGQYCLLSNNRSDDLSVVSYTEAREVTRLKMGRAPKHISVGRIPEAVLRRYGG